MKSKAPRGCRLRDRGPKEIALAEVSLAGPTRTSRGVALYLDRRDEIERVGSCAYRVPSCSTEETYLVWLDLRACTCPDHKRAKSQGLRCKHYTAATLAHQHRKELRAMCKREMDRS